MSAKLRPQTADSGRNKFNGRSRAYTGRSYAIGRIDRWELVASQVQRRDEHSVS